MNAVSAIRIKRDGGILSPGQIGELIDGLTQGSVPDYQVSAFLMAAFLNGLNESETAALLDAMLHSGKVLSWGEDAGPHVDKHSTGGVGDKTSLVLAPLASACGVRVPMISGRGLGHTGGTLDKMESIPGFRTDISIPEMRRQLDAIGVVMMGQTEDIAPADRKIYALRDVTATVEFIPFIAASILSKKLAAGLDGLVLDVKTGAGAFMVSEADARRLAEVLCDTSEIHGCRTVARLTRMESPLGRAAGNWVEVEESIACLKGGGPPDLRNLVLCLATEMILLAGIAESMTAACEMATRALDEGRALERFRDLVLAQGGDVRVVDEPTSLRLRAESIELRAPKQARGFVSGVGARQVGTMCVGLGAGRLRKEAAVDPLAGVVLNKTVGDPVSPGELLATVYASSRDRLESAAEELLRAFRFDEHATSPGTLIVDRYERGQWLTEDSGCGNRNRKGT